MGLAFFIQENKMVLYALVFAAGALSGVFGPALVKKGVEKVKAKIASK